jgi:hypothetical protein
MDAKSNFEMKDANPNSTRAPLKIALSDDTRFRDSFRARGRLKAAKRYRLFLRFAVRPSSAPCDAPASQKSCCANESEP